MKKQDAVFQLIKSLTRGEKRNFRMLAQLTSGDKKKYLQLFDVMDSLEEYDESKILKRFRKDSSFQKQFAYNKNYLYNSILNSLTYFHKGNEAELSALTLQVTILLQKNLYSHAKKLVRKVKEKVVKLERFEELLKLLQMELEILRRTENIKLLEEAVREVEIQEKITLEKIANLMTFRRLLTKSFLLLKTRHIVTRSERDQQLYKAIATHELLEEETSALSVKARIIYNEIHRRLAYYMGNQEECRNFAERGYALYNSNPALIDESKLDYLSHISHLAVHQHNTIGFEASIRTVGKLRSIKVSTPQERVFVFTKYYLILIAAYIVTGHEEEARELVDEAKKELKYLNHELGEAAKMVTYYFFGYFNFIHEDYSEALHWINKILNQPRMNLRTDLQSSARLLCLLIHFEMGDYELVEYRLKSTYRYLYKEDRLQDYERLFMRFMKSAISLPKQDGMISLLEQYQNDVVALKNDPIESLALNFFELEAWIISKLEGKSFATVLQERSSIKPGEMKAIRTGS